MFVAMRGCCLHAVPTVGVLQGAVISATSSLSCDVYMNNKVFSSFIAAGTKASAYTVFQCISSQDYVLLATSIANDLYRAATFEYNIKFRVVEIVVMVTLTEKPQ